MNRDKSARFNDTKEFFVEASAGTAGTFRRVTKPPKYFEPSQSPGQQGSRAPMTLVVKKLEEWSAVWQVGETEVQSEDATWLRDARNDNGDDALPLLEADQVIKASKRFSASPALKVDNLHPKVWQQLQRKLSRRSPTCSTRSNASSHGLRKSL